MPVRSKRRCVRRTYEFIKSHQDEYDVVIMCRVLDVARAGHYARLREPLSNRVKEDARLLRLIRASYKASHGVYEARQLLRTCAITSIHSTIPSGGTAISAASARSI
jgi:hypothetical protein